MSTNNYSDKVPPPSRELLIPSALDELQAAIDRIGKVSEDLAQRLEKVCAPSQPSNPTDKAEVAPIRAEYVENLRGKVGRVNRICEMLENIMQRLEL